MWVVGFVREMTSLGAEGFWRCENVIFGGTIEVETRMVGDEGALGGMDCWECELPIVDSIKNFEGMRTVKVTRLHE